VYISRMCGAKNPGRIDP